MDAGVDSMAKRNVVRDLVQFAVHGDLSCVSARIGLESKSIADGHSGIGNHEMAIEEELQNGNASAGDAAMAGRIRRMGRRAFWESLGKEIIPILSEALLHRLRVKHVVVRVALQRSAM